jgi:hypothetical protein
VYLFIRAVLTGNAAAATTPPLLLLLLLVLLWRVTAAIIHFSICISSSATASTELQRSPLRSAHLDEPALDAQPLVC